MEPGKRREQILAAAAAAFARKGYHQTSIADILHEAGIARGTIYLYFADKKAILHALIDRWFAEVEVAHQQTQVGLKQEDLNHSLRENLYCWFQFFHERRDLTQILFREAVSIDSHFTDRMQEMNRRANRKRCELLTQLQQSGYLRDDIQVDILNSCLNSIFREVVLEHILPFDEPDLRSIVDQVQRFIDDGARKK